MGTALARGDYPLKAVADQAENDVHQPQAGNDAQSTKFAAQAAQNMAYGRISRLLRQSSNSSEAAINNGTQVVW